MQSIIIKFIMSFGIHKAVDILFALAKIIVKKTKSQKDDVVIQTLILIWDELDGVIPKNIKNNLR